MENLDKRQPEEKINHPEQLNIDRNDKTHLNQGNKGDENEVEYTEQEIEFADGKGTKLAESFDQDQEKTPQDDDTTGE